MELFTSAIKNANKNREKENISIRNLKREERRLGKTAKFEAKKTDNVPGNYKKAKEGSERIKRKQD